MAQAIITQVTLSQLNTLIAGSATTWNQNYWGTQFYVTDKQWLLHAHKDNICKPVDGKLTITNGDTLPTGVEPEILMVDTGVISTSLVDTPLTISTITGYKYIRTFAKITTDDAISGLSLVDNVSSYIASMGGDYSTCEAIMTNIGTEIIAEGNYGLSATYHPTGSTVQAVIEFHKSPFA